MNLYCTKGSDLICHIDVACEYLVLGSDNYLLKVQAVKLLQGTEKCQALTLINDLQQK